METRAGDGLAETGMVLFLTSTHHTSLKTPPKLPQSSFDL